VYNSINLFGTGGGADIVDGGGDIKASVVTCPIFLCHSSLTDAMSNTEDSISMIEEEINKVDGNSGKSEDLIVY